jgi:hypothetical protein
MKPTPLQFDVRENTASSRQHASRLAVNLSTPMSHRLQTDQSVQVSPPSSVPKEAHQSALDQNAAAIEATGGKKADDVQLLSVQEVASLLHVPVSWVYEHTRPRCATPLHTSNLESICGFSRPTSEPIWKMRGQSIAFCVEYHDDRRYATNRKGKTSHKRKDVDSGSSQVPIRLFIQTR